MAALALEHAPAARLPLGFLCAVPAWGMVAALLVLAYGSTLWLSRWTPATIALVHCFTLGVLGNGMLGSLAQFLPVAAGVRPRLPRAAAVALPCAYNVGAFGLVAGLLGNPRLVAHGGCLLAISLTAFALAMLSGFRFDGRQTQLRVALALAIVALGLTGVLGLLLALAWAGWVRMPMPVVADIHAAMGLVGGAVLLAGAVGSVALPMFQGTVRIPARALQAWVALVVAALAGAIGLRWGWPEDAGLARAILAVPLATLALAILILQQRAPHRRNPSLVAFWRLGSSALLASALVALAGPGADGGHREMLAGTLLVAIALPALVLGMWLEILGFLSWLALQAKRPLGMRLPGIDALFPEARKAWILRAHVLAAAALGACAAWPHPLLAGLAGIALALAYGLSLAGMLDLLRRTRRIATRLDACVAVDPGVAHG